MIFFVKTMGNVVFTANTWTMCIWQWKSTVKRDHVQKFSVKMHTWILPNLLLEIHGFLSFRGIFRLFWLNEICRVGFLLNFCTIKNIFLKLTILELFLAKVRSFSNAYKFWTNPSKSGFLTPKGRSVLKKF